MSHEYTAQMLRDGLEAREENKALRRRVAELEGALEIALDWWKTYNPSMASELEAIEWVAKMLQARGGEGGREHGSETRKE